MRDLKVRGKSAAYILLGFVAYFSPAANVLAQQPVSQSRFIQVSAGIGVDAHWDPSIMDYINAVTLPSSGQKLTGFTSASEFFVTPEAQVSDDWSVGLEYSYFLKSYNVTGFYQWDFSYTAQLPTVFVHYLVTGQGYWLKFGGGAGYAFGKLSSEFLQTGGSQSASASGPSFKVEAIGNTEFDEHFWGSIGVDLRWVYAGSFKGGIVSSAPTPKLDFFDAGVKFGVTVQL